jgi:hypothetical protein
MNMVTFSRLETCYLGSYQGIPYNLRQWGSRGGREAHNCDEGSARQSRWNMEANRLPLYEFVLPVGETRPVLEGTVRLSNSLAALP